MRSIGIPRDDKFQFSGRSFILENIAKSTGKTLDFMMNELKRKEAYIILMDKKNVHSYEKVSKAINDYYVDPINAGLELEKLK